MWLYLAIRDKTRKTLRLLKNVFRNKAICLNENKELST